MLQRAICLSGPDAPQLFYDPEKFQRTGAVQLRIQKTLFGVGAIHTLDDAAHRHRKAMIMTQMTPASIQAFTDLMTAERQRRLEQWERRDRVIRFSEAQALLCRAACAWAGVPLSEAEVVSRTRDFVAMVEGFGALGPRHWRARSARRRTEGWIGGLIAEVRSGKLTPAETTPMHAAA